MYRLDNTFVNCATILVQIGEKFLNSVETFSIFHSAKFYSNNWMIR